MSTFYIYGREGCGNCVQAQAKVRRGGGAFEYLSYDEHEVELKASHDNIPRSLPVIIHEGEVVLYTTLDPYLRKVKAKG